MEADLSRYHRIDIRDRWRPDEHGQPRLTLRMIAVRIRHLPPDSALRLALADGEVPWTRNDVLVADLWSVWTGKEHPRLVEAARAGRRRAPVSAERQQAINKARARAAARRKAIEAGEIT